MAHDIKYIKELWLMTFYSEDKSFIYQTEVYLNF